MISGITFCECTVEYGEDSMIGVATEMKYQGNGIYTCPACKTICNYSKYIFRVKVEIILDDDYHTLKILEPEERILEHWDGDSKNFVIKDSLEDELNDTKFFDTWLEKHELGTFIIEIYYEPMSYMTDCGMEYDIETFIMKEEKL